MQRLPFYPAHRYSPQYHWSPAPQEQNHSEKIESDCHSGQGIPVKEYNATRKNSGFRAVHHG